MKLNKKGMELPINVVVMVIIGIIIFSMGLALFSGVMSEGSDEIDDISKKVKTGIESLECEGEDWLCAPGVSMKDGDTRDFTLYIANKGDLEAEFLVNIVLDDVNGGKGIISKQGCGEIIVIYPEIPINVFSGEGAEIPYRVKANNIKKTPCSFIKTAVLKKNNDNTFEEKKAAMIITVE